jgi:hypothetical protein
MRLLCNCDKKVMMSTDTVALIDRFEKGIQLIESAVRGTPDVFCDRAPAPGWWSIRQIVVHVADADVVSAMRFRLIAAQPGSRLTRFDQEIWAERLSYNRQPLSDALNTFVAVRKYTAQMLRNLPESAWSNTAVHEEQGEVSLAAYVEQMCVHVENHAEEISKARSKFEGDAKA